ncbi:MAG: DUF302 domain-containing protein [Armatimonadetes bacterium]|nr:MAG: DUF302 domain-containing protein [Armatimonadota bacterium]
MYGYERTSTLSFDEAETAIRKTLADHGFGILTEIDVAATLKAKLGVERDAYKILGACNPALANQAIGFDDEMGLLLPCNVVVATVDGSTRVSVVDPHAMLGVAGDSAELAKVASEARDKLVAALEAIN